jgi:hypothetical protein
VSVTFTPTATGSQSAQVQLVDDAPDSPQLTTVKGKGRGGPASVTGGTVRVSRSGSAPLRVRCRAASARCIGAISLTASGRRIGSASFRIAAGSSASVAVPLTRSALDAVERGRLRASGVLTNYLSSGSDPRQRFTVVLT